MENSQQRTNETNNGLNINNSLASDSSSSKVLNSSTVPKTNAYPNPNIAGYQNQVGQKEEDPGIFGRFANYLKSFWAIEEEEYIDAHGFVSKRPKTKLPLRNKKEGDNNDIQAEGTNSLNYASQHSGFGRMFL